MDLSPIGRAAIEAREGCRLTAYLDTVGVLTIGYGHTTAAGGLTVTPGLTITQAQADALFAIDIEKYVAAVHRALTRPVPQPFFDACVSLCYNIGPGGFARASVVRLANAGNLAGAADAFLMWNKPARIVSRRQGEHDQAALIAYGAVYARRGDHAPVKAPAGSAASKVDANEPPKPALPAHEPAAKPAPSGGLSSAHPPTQGAAPASAPGGLAAGILGRLRAAYPATPKKV